MNNRTAKNVVIPKLAYIQNANIQTDNFFQSVNSFVSSNYGYQLKSWYSVTGISEYDLYLYKNCCQRTFYLCISDKIVKRLLDEEEILYDSEKFHLYVGQEFSNKSVEVTSKDEFDKAILNLCIIRDWEEEEAVMKSCKHSPKKKSSSGILKRIGRIFS